MTDLQRFIFSSVSTRLRIGTEPDEMLAKMFDLAMEDLIEVQAFEPDGASVAPWPPPLGENNPFGTVDAVAAPNAFDVLSPPDGRPLFSAAHPGGMQCKRLTDAEVNVVIAKPMRRPSDSVESNFQQIVVSSFESPETECPKAEPKPKKVEEEEPESGTSYCGVVIPPYRPAQINFAIRNIANGRMEEAALAMGFTDIELERWMARWPERWAQLARLRSPGQVNQFIAEFQGKWE